MKKIFVLRLFKILVNQSASGLNRGLSSNFWGLRNANHVKFTEECVMCMVKHVLARKMFSNGKNMSLLQRAWVKKALHGVKTHWLFSKKWFLLQRSVKKVMLRVFWGVKGSITYDFQEKGTTVNSVSYFQFLGQNLPYLLNFSRKSNSNFFRRQRSNTNERRQNFKDPHL